MGSTSKNKEFNISGKTLVFTDLHLGLKNSNLAWLDICRKVVSEIIDTIKREKIKNVIFCGDFFHSRKQIDLVALCCGFDLITSISENAKLYLICGNHDAYFKHTNEINSIKIFRDAKNVEVIDSDPVAGTINGQRALFAPWDASMNYQPEFEKESFDLLFGHLNFSRKYFISSYYKENGEEIGTSRELLGELGISADGPDFPESMIDTVKEGGTVYAGHIHAKKEFVTKSRNIVFIGSPYEQNFGERHTPHGFYILSKENVPTFVEITCAPKHVILRMSEVLTVGPDDYDFSKVAGNVVKKLYDIEVSKPNELKIEQAITDNRPFEEALSEYEVESSGDSGIISNETLEVIKKSKLEYIQSYLDRISDSVLEDLKLEKSKIFEIIKSYYDKIVK